MADVAERNAMRIAQDAVVRVGGGRGFVIEADNARLIVTAAHCLPHFPPCHGGSYTEERTYPNLVGRIGDEPSIWAECLFADPIGDIAVLGCPDGQELFEQWEAYEELLETASPLRVSEAQRTMSAWLLGLDGIWSRCTVRHVGGPLWIEGATAGIRGGMSGSPILADDATAIGVVCLGGAVEGVGGDPTSGGPNPRLMYHLPARFYAS